MRARPSWSPMSSLQPTGEPLPIILGSGGGGLPEKPWWGRYVTQQAFERMAVEIEQVRGRVSAHEKECALRYGRIEERSEEQIQALQHIKDSVGSLATTVNDIKNTQAVQKVVTQHVMTKLQLWVLVGALGILLGFSAWSAKQLYDLEPGRPAPAAAHS